MKSVLVQVEAWCLLGDKPLPEPMLTDELNVLNSALGNEWVKQAPGTGVIDRAADRWYNALPIGSKGSFPCPPMDQGSFPLDARESNKNKSDFKAEILSSAYISI